MDSMWAHEHGDLVAEAARLLRERGGRMTAQRRAILEAFRSASEHPSAEELFAIASRGDPRLNLSTVYRTLRWLAKENLVREITFSEAGRSSRFDTARPAAHHHFVCTGCGAILEFDAAEVAALRRRMERRLRVQVDRSTLVLYGRCAACSQPAGKRSPG